MRRWTKYEVDIIRSQYGKIKNTELAQMINRSCESLEGKAKYMGITNQDHSQKIKKSKQEHHMKVCITVRPMTALERIPPLPGLLDHLESMSGCMAAEIANTTNRREAYLKRIEAVKLQIKEKLRLGVTGHKIADEVGLPRGTVYDYIKAIKAAA